MSIRVKLIHFFIQFNENIFFYPKLKKTYKKLIKNPLPIFIDVGANKGQSIDFFLGLNNKAKIIAFEPNKKLYNYLKLKKYDNIIIENLGVSNTTGKLTFNENILDLTSTFESLNMDSKYLITKAKYLGVKAENIILNSYEVEVVSLCDYFIKNNIKEIDVLKIDVEGHELKCLQGLFKDELKAKIKYIQLEKHNDDMYSSNNQHSEIQVILSKNDFSQVAEIKHGFGDFTEIIYKKITSNETKYSNTCI